MIGGADENEPEAQPSTRTATAPSPSSPPIAPPSSPLPGTGLGRRLLGSIRAFALSAPPPAAAPKVGLGLLLHVSPDHPLLHPAAPSASPYPSASEDPLDEYAAAARPHADDAEPRSPLSRHGVADAAAASAPANSMFRPTHVASPSKDESIATDVSSASEEDDPVEDASERRHAAHAEPLSPVSRYRPIDPAAGRAPANTMLTQWASKAAPHLLQHLMPAADTDGDQEQESGLVGGQQAEEFRAGDESRPTNVASPSEDEEDESVATDASEEDDPLEDAAERRHAADPELLSPVNRYRLMDPAARRAPANTMLTRWASKASPHLLQHLRPDTGGDLALEDHDAAAGDDQEEKVLQQCTGDQLRAARDDQEVVQHGAIHPRDETTCDIAADDQEKVGSAENIDAVEGQEFVEQDAIDRKGEGTDGTAADDQDKAVEQSDTYGLGTSENGDAEKDESVATDASEEDDPLEDAAERRHAADPELLSPVNRYRLMDPAARRAPANTMLTRWASKASPHLLQHLRPDTGGDLALEDHDAAAGDDQEEKVLQQCTGDQLRAARDDQEVVQHGAIHPRDETTCDIAADDQEKVGSAENIDAVEGQEFVEQDAIDRKGEGTDGTAADDQDKAVEQSDTYGLGTSENGDAENEQEVVEQCAIDKEGAAMDDNVGRDHEVAGPTLVDGMRATIDDIYAEDLEKEVEQYATYDSTENDNAVEDQEVVQQGTIHPRDETTYDIAVEDQEKVGPAENVDVMEDQELVEQDAIDRKGEGTNGTAVDGQDKAVEQCDSYGLGTSKNGDAENDQEAVEQCVIDKEGAAMDDNAVKVYEVAGPTVVDGMRATIDDIYAGDLEKKVEQYATYDSTENDNDVEDQEVVQQGAIHPRDETTYDIAVEDQEKVGSAENVDVVEGQELVEQDKAVEQCDSYGLGTTENSDIEDDREAVEQCVIDKKGAAMDDNAVNDHEVAGPTVVDGMRATIDDISTEDLEEKVEQYATYDSIETDNAVEDQELVQQGAIHPRNETTYAIAAEEQEKVGSAENVNVAEGQELVEQDAIDRKGEGTDGTAAEGQNKDVEQCGSYGQELVEQDAIDRKGEGTDGTAAEGQDKAVEQCGSYGLGTTENGDAEDDGEVMEQCVIDKERADMDDNAVKYHEVVGPTEGTDSIHSVVNDISAEDQEKKVEQYATYDSEAIENDDVVEDQGVVEQEIVFREGLTIDHDDSVEDYNVVDQSIIERMPASTDDIFVEYQKEVVEQCAVHEPRATEDEYTVKEKEKVVEQRVIDKQGASNMDVAANNQDKLMKEHIIDNQGTVPMDDIAVKDLDKAAAQYASDVIITYRNDNPVEEHNKVGNQGVIDENGRTKDDIYVEEDDYLKEQVIIDNWGTFSDATALEDQKNEGEQCKGDEQIVGKDMYAVHMKGSMLEQRTGGKQGATKSDFTVEKYKDVVECVCHEWGAPDDDLAMDTAASQSIREVSSSEVVSAMANGSDGGIWKKEKVKLPIRYPQRPGKLNCPFYMSSGSCSYGFSCQFHHPPLKAKPDGSWRPSEQGNHGVAETLELNRIGLPIRRGARNCTYYMRNGACRYGKHCHFNHPEHVIDAQFYTPTGWEDNALQLEKSSDQTTLDDTSHLKKSSDDTTLGGTSYSKKSSDHATLDGTSYSKKSSDHATLDDTSSSSEILPPNILRMLLPSQKVLPSTEVKVKKDSDWPSTSDDSDGCCSADSSDGPLCKQEHVDYPERPGRPECPFYMRFGDCKFASACKYHHSKDKYPTRYHPKVPSLGGEQTEYPERPGEPECPFYMKTRFCKFGAQCRFNHPKDSSPTVQNSSNAKKSVASNEHHQSTTTTLEDYMPQQQQYPERPGQPDCRYYLQFGECKFLSACIFNHPRDELPVGWNPSGPAHSDQIEPETHGMPECPFYMRSGKCQFGSACEFLHPKDICSTTEGAFGHRTDLADDTSTRPENVVQKQEQAMYPERPGEPRCFDYMSHGSCRRQMNCKYHHPADRLSRKQYDSTYH
ncbi:hypothetical protein ACQ4PT_046039 [Festuca glaucescens]